MERRVTAAIATIAKGRRDCAAAGAGATGLGGHAGNAPVKGTLLLLLTCQHLASYVASERGFDGRLSLCASPLRSNPKCTDFELNLPTYRKQLASLAIVSR